MAVDLNYLPPRAQNDTLGHDMRRGMNSRNALFSPQHSPHLTCDIISRYVGNREVCGGTRGSIGNRELSIENR